MAFDSREYEWADLTVFIGGNDIIGIRGVKYSEKIEREHMHAKGRHPHSIQSGNINYEGEITLTQSEVQKLQKAGKGSLLSLNVDIQVSYGNPSNGDAITHDRLSGVRFSETGKDLKQGDKFMEVTVPFLATGLKNDV